MIDHLIIFGIGLGNSLLATLFYSLVAKNRALGAAILAFPVYGIALFVINKVLIIDKSFLDAVLYVSGCSVGTFITTYFSKRIGVSK